MDAVGKGLGMGMDAVGKGLGMGMDAVGKGLGMGMDAVGKVAVEKGMVYKNIHTVYLHNIRYK
jgi:hypothetical protein